MEHKAKVSVCMITYGHEKFIEQAISGVLMQESDFEVELIIANDCSPDKTDEIIQKIIDNHPKSSWIKYIKHDKNLGMMPNFIFAMQQCAGEYIALCEGDDYWTYPLKLQKQVDFLEANKEYSMCFHKIKILKPNSDLVDDFITTIPQNYQSQETLARSGNYIHTPSVVFRNVIETFPSEFTIAPIGDYFLYMLLSEHGKLHYIGKEMAVYREGVGIWSGKSNYYRTLNTAFLYALLVSVFDKNGNVGISDIFLKRIESFLDKFRTVINSQELSNLCINFLVSKTISTWLIRENNILKRQIIDKKTTMQLIKVIFHRLRIEIKKK